MKKRILALTLVLSLLVSSTLPAFAAEEDSSAQEGSVQTSSAGSSEADDSESEEDTEEEEEEAAAEKEESGEDDSAAETETQEDAAEESASGSTSGTQAESTSDSSTSESASTSSSSTSGSTDVTEAEEEEDEEEEEEEEESAEEEAGTVSSVAGNYVSPYVSGASYLLEDPDSVVLGIDVSYYQGTIDWEAVAADGVEFAFIRAAVRYSGSGTLAVDSKFYDNIEGALENGIKVGVYVFSQAVTEEEAAEEAAFLVDLVSDYDIDLPLVFDPEFVTSSTTGKCYGRLYKACSALSSSGQEEFLAGLYEAFAEEVERAGYVPMYYGSYSWLEDEVDDSGFSTPVWLARYNTYAGYSGEYAFWQYSDSGSVEGIKGDVDVNFCFNTDYLDCQSLAEPVVRFDVEESPEGNLSAEECALSGTVSSYWEMESVTLEICSLDGTVLQSAAAEDIGSEEYSLDGLVLQPASDEDIDAEEDSLDDSGLPETVDFTALEEGRCYLTITAADAEGNTAEWNSSVFAIGDDVIFTDVTDPTSWFCSTVYAMADAGLFTGMNGEDGTYYFSADQDITRIEVVVVLYRLSGSPEVESTHPFTDADGSWYQDALNWAYEEGIAEGTGGTLFEPDAAVTREAIAAMLCRYMEADALDEDCLSQYTDVEELSGWAEESVNWCVANGILTSTSSSELILASSDNATRAVGAQMLLNLTEYIEEEEAAEAEAAAAEAEADEAEEEDTAEAED